MHVAPCFPSVRPSEPTVASAGHKPLRQESSYTKCFIGSTGGSFHLSPTHKINWHVCVRSPSGRKKNVMIHQVLLMLWTVEDSALPELWRFWEDVSQLYRLYLHLASLERDSITTRDRSHTSSVAMLPLSRFVRNPATDWSEVSLAGLKFVAVSPSSSAVSTNAF